MINITRPILRYHGGKWRIAPWVISHFPPHRMYVEPFGGGASVLIRKERCYAEIYNDLDEEVVNVFRVLRDPDMATELERLLRLTPFSRIDFEEAYQQPESSQVRRARHTVIKAFMGFGSNGIHRSTSGSMRTTASTSVRPSTGLRHNCTRTGTTPAHNWATWPDGIRQYTERLKGVVIENRPALEVIATHDHEDALIYCDPPYVKSTRSDAGDDYHHEMNDDDHRALAELLHQCRGMVIISGYQSPLYQQLYDGWFSTIRVARADRAAERTEVLWMNAAARKSGQMKMGI